MPRQNRKSSAENARAFGALGAVGLAFVLSIVIGAGIGYLLDRRFGTNWIWIPGFVLGVAAGIVNVYRTASKFIK